MRRKLLAQRAACLGILLSQTSHASATLELAEVLNSALDLHPKMHIAESKVAVAEGYQVQARGAFDLQLYAEGGYTPVGKYTQPRGLVGVKQPTTLLGAEFFAKYENGANYAPYDGALVTSEAGKVSLGVLIPLAQGSAIDHNRLERYRAQVELTIAQESLRNERAQLLAQAASSYWKWVATGNKLLVYRALLHQAEQRQTFLKEQVKVGAIPAIESSDNDRLVAQRRADLAVKNWEFRQLSLQMGIYRRSAEGRPKPTTEEELPEARTTTSMGRIALDDALTELINSPGLRIYRSTVEIIEKELRLAKNDQLPQVDLQLFTTQGLGKERAYSTNDSSFTGTSAGGTLTMSFDVQRRKARGKAAVLQAKQRVLEAEMRLLLDQLTINAQAEFAALSAQHDAAHFSREATQLAGEVARAESESFSLGQSSILSVNLREQAALSAQLSELDSLLAFQLAWVELQRIAGESEVAAYLPPPAEGAP